jgi:hypothetical protein
MGSNFVNGSVVTWEGSNRPTTFISATELRAAISAEDYAIEGWKRAVRVFNPAPGGGLSNTAFFEVW